ncbi:sulfate adenylyltransferase subunit 2 [Pelagibacteraceae bacterium]|nr:sulfate adenylyltransferase subunit 2 [Pelagibacteraceae bacterium]
MQNLKKRLLGELEAESISVIRDSLAMAENPVLLYSIGKDSNVLLHLLRKSFFPLNVSIPLLHIDTGWKFKEMIKFKQKVIKKYKLNLTTYTNQDAKNLSPQKDKNYTHYAKTVALRQALDKKNFDIIFGGARRDEEVSRSKERIISIREHNHSWNPKEQRPEIWRLFNYKKKNDQSFRVFPLSNWTELDIWEYIKNEQIEIPNLYFAQKRPVTILKDQIIMIDDERLNIEKKKILYENIRFRTLGCYPLTAATKSKANNIDLIIKELKKEKNSERVGRLIDNDSFNSMETKKKEGYF